MRTKKNTAEPEKKKKPISAAQARREVMALEKFLEDGDIGLPEFWRMKQAVIDRLMSQ